MLFLIQVSGFCLGLFSLLTLFHTMVTHKEHSNETLSKKCCKAWVSCAIALYTPSLCQRITLKRNYDSSIIESTPFYHRTSLTLLVLSLILTIIILIFSNRRNKKH